MLRFCSAANVEAAVKLLAILALGTVLAATKAQRMSDQIVGALASAETIQLAKQQACQDFAVVGYPVPEGSCVRGDSMPVVHLDWGFAAAVGAIVFASAFVVGIAGFAFAAISSAVFWLLPRPKASS